MDGKGNNLKASDKITLKQDSAHGVDVTYKRNGNAIMLLATVGQRNLSEENLVDGTHIPEAEISSKEPHGGRDGSALGSPFPESATDRSTPTMPPMKEGKQLTVVAGNADKILHANNSVETPIGQQNYYKDMWEIQNMQVEIKTEPNSTGETNKDREESTELRHSGDLPKITVHSPAGDVIIDVPGLAATVESKTMHNEQLSSSSAHQSINNTPSSQEDPLYEDRNPLNEPTNKIVSVPGDEAECGDMADAHATIQLPLEGAAQQEDGGNTRPAKETVRGRETVAIDQRIEETANELYSKCTWEQLLGIERDSDRQSASQLTKEMMAKVAEKQVDEDIIEHAGTIQPAAVDPAHADCRSCTPGCEMGLPRGSVGEVIKEGVDERVNVAGMHADGHVNVAGVNAAGVNVAGVDGAGVNVAGMHADGHVNVAGVNVAGVDGAGVNVASVNGDTFTASVTTNFGLRTSPRADGRGHGTEAPTSAPHKTKEPVADDHQDSLTPTSSAASSPKGVEQREKKKPQEIEGQKKSDQTEARNSAPSKDLPPTTDAQPPPTSTSSITIDKAHTVSANSNNMDSVSRRGVHSSRSRGLGRGHQEDRTTDSVMYEVIPGNRRHKGFQPQEVLAKAKQIQENSSTNIAIETSSNGTSQQNTTVQPQSNGLATSSTPLGATATISTLVPFSRADGKRKIPVQRSPTTGSVKGSQQAWESNVILPPLPDTATLMAKYNLKPEPQINFNALPSYHFKHYSPMQPPALSISPSPPKSSNDNTKPSTPKVSFSTGAKDHPIKTTVVSSISATNGRTDPNYVPPHLRSLMTNHQGSAPASNMTSTNGSASHVNVASNPKPVDAANKGVLTTQDKLKRQNPWKVGPPSQTGSRPQGKPTPTLSSDSIDSNAPMGSVLTPKKRQTLDYEERLSGWDGNWAPAPLDWDYRPAYDNNSKKKVRAVEAWAQGRADDAINNPIEIDTKKDGFRSGDEPASGLENLDLPIAKEEHETILPDDPQTLQHCDVTVNDIVNKKLNEAKAKKEEAKEVRRFHREHNRQIDRELKENPIINPRAPNADIYIRPATRLDLPTITAIYNFYIKNSIITSELEELNETQWLNRWEDVEKEDLPFFVAVLRSPKGTDNRRGRRQPDAVVGFAYAEEYGNLKSAFKYTCEIQFFVRNNYLKQGIGKTLVDRMIASMDPGYTSWMATDFLAEDHLRYEMGGRRLIRSILIQVPYNSKDDSGMQWKKAWLDKEWEFKHVGTLPGVAFKLGKMINIALFLMDTSTTVEELRRPKWEAEYA